MIYMYICTLYLLPVDKLSQCIRVYEAVTIAFIGLCARF